MLIKKLILLLLLLGAAGASAQTVREQIASDPNLAGGLYHAYRYEPAHTTPPPKGYEPFYISHFGRHGCRWQIDPKVYTSPLALLRGADETQTLTPLGKDLLARMEVIAADAEGRYGDLSPRGVQDHRGIAERMYRSYPQVFRTKGRECCVEARSTLVPRCILSMAAFSERLKELDPAIQVTRVASARELRSLANGDHFNFQYPAVEKVVDSLLAFIIEPTRLVQSLVTDTTLFAQQKYRQEKFGEDLFQVAAIMQDIDYLGISLYDLFTPDELYTAWETVNRCRYLVSGPSVRFGNALLEDAGTLLAGMLREGNRAVLGRGPAVSLRFCHDVNIMPLAALLGIECASARVEDLDQLAEVWNDFRVSPMAVNIQFLFFRKRTGEVLVKVLFNEQEVLLPVGGELAPYYKWDEFRTYYEWFCR